MDVRVLSFQVKLMAEPDPTSWWYHMGQAIAAMLITFWIIGQATLLSLALDQWP